MTAALVPHGGYLWRIDFASVEAYFKEHLKERYDVMMGYYDWGNERIAPVINLYSRFARLLRSNVNDK